MTNETTATASRRAILRDRRGSTTIEYALLACLIAIAGAVGIAPYGTALAQELSSLSLDHLIAPQPATPGCHRPEWSDAELRHLVPQPLPKPD